MEQRWSGRSRHQRGLTADIRTLTSHSLTVPFERCSRAIWAFREFSPLPLHSIARSTLPHSNFPYTPHHSTSTYSTRLLHSHLLLIHTSSHFHTPTSALFARGPFLLCFSARQLLSCWWSEVNGRALRVLRLAELPQHRLFTFSTSSLSSQPPERSLLYRLLSYPSLAILTPPFSHSSLPFPLVTVFPNASVRESGAAVVGPLFLSISHR